MELEIMANHTDCIMLKNEIASFMLKELQTFLRDNMFSDLTVKIDGHEFICHYLILSACSKYFKREVFKLLSPGKMVELDLTKRCSKKTFESILEFIYYGSINVPLKDLKTFVLETAFLEMDSLKYAVEKANKNGLHGRNNMKLILNTGQNGKYDETEKLDFEKKQKETIKMDDNNEYLEKIVLVCGSLKGSLKNKVQTFDSTNNTFEDLPNLPEYLSYSSSATLNNELYVTGGINRKEVSKAVYCFNPITKEWTKKESLNTKRFGHSLVCANAKLFAIGGSAKIVTTSVECYDPIENRWRYMSPLPEVIERFAICASEDGKNIYLFGGTLKECKISNKIYAYNVITNTWSDGGYLLSSRYALKAACANNRILLFGGYNCGAKGIVEEYLPDKQRVVPKKCMQIERYFSMVVPITDKVYILGGTTGNFSVEVYDVTSMTSKVFSYEYKREDYGAALLRFT